MGKTEQFLNDYGLNMTIAAEDSGIFPSVMLAQAALESAWGQSGLTRNGNALFGIKAFNQPSPYWKGKKYTANSKEYENGSYTNNQHSFRAYDSKMDSIRDYVWFLQHNPTYSKNGVFTASSPEEQARALKAAGYATDPQYADKLISIINTYNLKKYDSKKKIMKYLELTAAIIGILFAGWTIYKNFK